MIEEGMVLPQISKNIQTSELITIYNKIENGDINDINFRISSSFGGSSGVPIWRFLEKTTENQENVLLVCLLSCHFDHNAPIRGEKGLSSQLRNMINYMAMNFHSHPNNISIDGSGVELNVHTGYYIAAKNVVTTLQNELDLNQYNEIIFFGHCLGGAVAEIAAIYLQENLHYKQAKGFGFGIPCCVSKSLSKLTSMYCLTLVNPNDPFTTFKTIGKLMAKANGLLILQRTNIELFKEKLKLLESIPTSEYFFPEMNVNIKNYGVANGNSLSIKTTLRWEKQAQSPPDIKLEELINCAAIHSAANYQRMAERAQKELQEESPDDTNKQNFYEIYRRKLRSFYYQRSLFEDVIRNTMALTTDKVDIIQITPESDEESRNEIVALIESEEYRIIEANDEFEKNQQLEKEINEEKISEEKIREEKIREEKIREEKIRQENDRREREREEERRRRRNRERKKRRNIIIGVAVLAPSLANILRLLP